MAFKLSKKSPAAGVAASSGKGLFSKIGIGRAFVLIALLFLLPVAMLIYNASQQSNTELHSLEKERRGVSYLGPVRNLWRELTTHRGVTNPLLNNDPLTTSRRESVRAQVNGAFEKIKLTEESADSIDVKAALVNIEKEWETLKADIGSMDEPANFAAHNKLLDEIQSLTVTVADNSELTLDTALDSYYLQDSFVNRLPSVLHQTGLARRLAGEVAIKKTITAEDRALYVDLTRLFPILTANLSEGYRRALNANEALATNLNADVNAAIIESKKVPGILKERLFEAPKIEAAPDEIRGQINKGALALFALGEKTLVQLDGILAQRQEKIKARLYTTLALASLVSLLGLLGLGLLARGAIRSAKARETQAKKVEEENRRNQAAILQLLNEMGNLADGDLTVRAQVTEDITGAIADSMNYTIEELRNLVKGVNGAALRVSERTQSAQIVSERLLDATDRQSREIEETTAQVLRVSQSINQVSVNANESAKVAQRSLEAAEKGAGAVQNSIKGMTEIREQIQETSKRIKRLGESSQEIGEIVELIAGITEQTNVLALNAAIQAASAGEAGRGFSVVAEEVQRLAERSGEATKQISAIVKTIQTDTHDAVVAMEKSTQGVVEGAKLSDAAGQALSEIGQVSKQLAALIQSISKATQEQATATDKVSKNMRDILTITKQTTEGTKETADSVINLSDLAGELKGSVSGFKL